MWSHNRISAKQKNSVLQLNIRAEAHARNRISNSDLLDQNSILEKQKYSVLAIKYQWSVSGRAEVEDFGTKTEFLKTE